MGGHAHASRKRGVRASRLKLYQALTDAGLKTQVALAVRIADLEGLDEVPRDLVNRVFREQPVEMASLERVARGLGVQAYTLYKTADDQDREFARSEQHQSELQSLMLISYAVFCLINKQNHHSR